MAEYFHSPLTCKTLRIVPSLFGIVRNEYRPQSVFVRAMNRKQILLCAAILAIQVLICLLWLNTRIGGWMLDVTGMLAPLLAAWAAWQCGRQGSEFEQRFWRLLALAFALWAGGQAAYVFYVDYLRQPLPRFSLIDLCYFFYGAPLCMALLLTTHTRDKLARSRELVDFLQVLTVISFLYIELFEMPVLRSVGFLAHERAAMVLYNLENIILLGAFALRAWRGKSLLEQTLYRYGSWYLSAYAVSAAIGNQVAWTWVTSLGAWVDIIWTLPFLLAAGLAWSWPRRAASLPALASEAPARQSRLHLDALLLSLLPLLIPLLFLLRNLRHESADAMVAELTVGACFLLFGMRQGISQILLDRSRERVDQELRQRVRAENELRESEARYRAIIEQSAAGIFIFDCETLRILESNPAMQSLLGYSAAELSSLRLYDVVDAPPGLVDDNVHKILTTGLHELGERMYRRRDGVRVPVEVIASQLLFGEQRLIAASVRDIRERKRSEAVWQRQALVFSNSTEAMALVDARGRLLDLNPAGERLLAGGREELAGCALGQFFINPPAEFDLAAAHGPGRWQGEMQILRNNGEKRVCEALALRLSGPGDIGLETNLEEGSIGLWFFRDVTEQRQLEDHLREAQKMEAVGRLAGGVAHDFNNLLTVILGHADLLRRVVKEEPHRQRIESVVQAAERAATLTGQLLAFGRRQALTPRGFDLSDLTLKLRPLLLPILGPSVTLQLETPAQPVPALADPGQIEQVLLNLVINARDALSQGGEIILAVRAAALPADRARELNLSPGNYACLQVSDNGSGMTAEVRARIFDPFFTTKPQGKGTGLGLAMVYGIVKQSGGGIEVASRLGAGSRFTIWLPRPDAIMAPELSVTATPTGGNQTILLVEDESEVRALAAEILSDFGYRVIDAPDGVSALERLHASGQDISLMLTDVVMPGMNGRELAERVRQEMPQIRILFMSGYIEGGWETAGAGGDLLRKPFTVQALINKVRASLESQSRAAQV